MNKKPPARLSNTSLLIGALGGGLVALSAKFLEATPCCSQGRTVVELAGFLLTLFLLVFAIVQIFRTLFGLFDGDWRRTLIRAGSVLAIPMAFIALMAPPVFDPDTWRLRIDGERMEREIVAKTPPGQPALAVVSRRDITRGLFPGAEKVTKEVIYDSSDEIAEPAESRSEGWKMRADRAFKGGCLDGAKDIQGARMSGHFFLVYHSCSQGV